MKTLLTLALLLSSANAFAIQTSQLTSTLTDQGVQEALEAEHIRVITDAPSARCMGCFALRFETINNEGTESAYEAHGMDFGGRFNVTIHKME